MILEACKSSYDFLNLQLCYVPWNIETSPVPLNRFEQILEYYIPIFSSASIVGFYILQVTNMIKF